MSRDIIYLVIGSSHGRMAQLVVPTGTFSRMRDVDVNRLLASRSLESTEGSPKNPNILGEIVRIVRIRSQGSVGRAHRSHRWGHRFESCCDHQLSPHVLIQSMRTSFCIYRLTNRQNTGYNYQIWAMGARNGLLSVILSEGGIRIPALFSLLMPTFRGRNQRFIMECTLRWTVAWYRPQCEVSSTVS